MLDKPDLVIVFRNYLIHSAILSLRNSLNNINNNDNTVFELTAFNLSLLFFKNINFYF